MKRHFSFQTRLFIVYTIFTAVLALIFTLVFYFYILDNYSKTLTDSISQMAQKTCQQLDASIFEMDSASRSIFGNWDNTIRPMTEFYHSKNDDQQVYNLHSSLSNIISVVKFAHKKIDRITVFSTKNYFATSVQNKYLSEEDLKRILPDASIKELTSQRTGLLLMPPKSDPWESSRKKIVLSAWQAVKNSGLLIGYIEIQKNYDEIVEICSLGDNSRIRMLVVDSQNNVIYPLHKSTGKPDTDFYMNAVQNDGNISYATNPATGRKEVVYTVFSAYTGWRIFAVEDYDDFILPLSLIVKTMIFIYFGIIIITLLVFNLLSRYLTKPLKLLKNKMDTITMSTLPQPIETEHENDEINALNTSFVKMKNRLESALSQEMQSRSLHLDAHFNALQAQINPHFLYNMLAVVAGLGDEAEKPEIPEICSKMSKMLRYSSSTLQKLATIEEEVSHTETYLSLMKKRFESRLDYTIQVDSSIFGIKIPKLILQPLVENSIYHGFDDFAGTMRISITGGSDANGWYIEVKDNGSGFKESILRELQDKIRTYKTSLAENKPSQELAIGGMGLLNTFARLQLLYDRQLDFSLGNNESSGACIRIGSQLRAE